MVTGQTRDYQKLRCVVTFSRKQEFRCRYGPANLDRLFNVTYRKQINITCMFSTYIVCFKVHSFIFSFSNFGKTNLAIFHSKLALLMYRATSMQSRFV